MREQDWGLDFDAGGGTTDEGYLDINFNEGVMG